ncbi:MAG: hypothetical protein KDB21_08005 [Acidimicrobiales bacterium]|nr:hypothetical protein [Acidimicrobiales bacterium]
MLGASADPARTIGERAIETRDGTVDVVQLRRDLIELVGLGDLCSLRGV